jgi:hypothetical protein
MYGCCWMLTRGEKLSEGMLGGPYRLCRSWLEGRSSLAAAMPASRHVVGPAFFRSSAETRRDPDVSGRDASLMKAGSLKLCDDSDSLISLLHLAGYSTQGRPGCHPKLQVG